MRGIGTHYPCLRAVYRVNGPSTRPVNTVVILDTREHGPSRRAVINNDCMIIFYAENALDSTGHQHDP